MKWLLFTAISVIFLGIGLALPYINEEYGTTQDTDFESDIEDLQDDIEGTSVVNFLTVILSIVKMFTWTFGTIPAWLDGILLIFRFLWWSIVVDILIPG